MACWIGWQDSFDPMRPVPASPAQAMGMGVALGPGQEFSLIDLHLRAAAAQASSSAVTLGIGDDAALLSPDPSQQIAVSVDTMVEGRHYWPDTDPRLLGRKLLCVNLSDLAAMGASPLACTLSLSLRSDACGSWLSAFSQGLGAATAEFGCPLVGGDTVRLPEGAPNVLTLQVLGQVPPGLALQRGGLLPGDLLWVSGLLGDPADAVEARVDAVKLHQPNPRIELGMFLRGKAHAAIDLSDGLASELAHLHAASESRSGSALSLQLQLDALSSCLGDRLIAHLRDGHMSRMQACRRAAEGGDEYELVFAAPADHQAALLNWAGDHQLTLTQIGTVHAATDSKPRGLDWWFQSVRCAPTECPRSGFDHFAQESHQP